MKKNISYAEAVEEIESIIEKIEKDEYSIDELTEQVKHAAMLLKTCREKLLNTEKEVEKILKQIEE